MQQKSNFQTFPVSNFQSWETTELGSGCSLQLEFEAASRARKIEPVERDFLRLKVRSLTAGRMHIPRCRSFRSPAPFQPSIFGTFRLQAVFKLSNNRIRTTSGGGGPSHSVWGGWAVTRGRDYLQKPALCKTSTDIQFLPRGLSSLAILFGPPGH